MRRIIAAVVALVLAGAGVAWALEETWTTDKNVNQKRVRNAAAPQAPDDVARLRDITNSVATWAVGAANRRVYLVDTVNGVDDGAHAGYLDGGSAVFPISGGTIAATAKKTLEAVEAIFPKYGAGRSVEIIIANGGTNTTGTYTGGLQSFMNGTYGWDFKSPMVRATGTNTTAGATAFAGDSADLIYLGGVTAASCNTAGYNPTGTPTTSVIQLLKVGGGAAALPAEPAAPLGWRVRFSSSTTTTALRNIARVVTKVAGTDTITVISALPATPAAGDVLYLEQAGVVMAGGNFTGPPTNQGLAIAGLTVAGILFNSTLNYQGGIHFAFSGGTNASFFASNVSVRQQYVHPTAGTITPGGGFHASTQWFQTRGGTIDVHGIVSETTTNIDTVTHVNWKNGSVAGTGLIVTGTIGNNAGTITSIGSTAAESGHQVSRVLASSAIVGAGVNFTNAKVQVGNIDITGAGSRAAILCLNSDVTQLRDSAITGSTGNTDVGLAFSTSSAGAFVNYGGSRWIINSGVTNTVTGSLGNVRTEDSATVATGEVITWAQAANGIFDAKMNGIVGSGAAFPIRALNSGTVLSGGTVTITSLAGTGTRIVTASPAGLLSTTSTASVADGDYGDITVSGSGATWTIDSQAVTLPKIVNFITDSFPCRDTAGTGSLEVCAVGGGIEFTGGPGIQRSAITGAVTASAGSNTTAFGVLAATSVLANATGSSAVPAALAATTNGDVLRMASGTLGWGAIPEASVTNLVTDLAAKEVALTFSTGLTRATNTITANLSTGVSGGQSVIGGTAASNNLTLSSTTNGTKGKVILGSASAYDEANDRLGLGTTSPASKFQIGSAITGLAQTKTISVRDTSTTDFANLAQLDASISTARAGVVVSNSGSTEWERNFIQMSVHGSTYPNDFYLGDSTTEAGFAMILAQGSEINEMAVGVYNAKPLSFFTNNAKRMTISSGGTVTVPDLAGTGTRIVSASSVGLVGIAASADIVGAITWPGSNRVVYAPTTSTIAGTDGVLIDGANDRLFIADGGTQVWRNTGGISATNYEQIREFWSSNVWNLKSEKGGTGIVRPMTIDADTSTLTLTGTSVKATSATTELQGTSNLELYTALGTNPDVIFSATQVSNRANATVASASGATFDAFTTDGVLTLSGSTHVTTAAGLNFTAFATPEIATAATVDYSATVTVYGAPFVSSGGGSITNRLALWVQDGRSRFGGMVMDAVGADIASTNNLTVNLAGTTGNIINITGNTQINTLNFTSPAGPFTGTTLTLVFASNPTVKHNTGTGIKFDLTGDVDYATAAGATLTVFYDGAFWKEIGRAAP